jgi:hypothetical protein
LELNRETAAKLFGLLKLNLVVGCTRIFSAFARIAGDHDNNSNNNNPQAFFHLVFCFSDSFRTRQR